jgi:NitT/TauT family transport system ATP-binding protein
MTHERLQDELVEIWSRTKLTVLFVTHAIDDGYILSGKLHGHHGRTVA